MDIIVHVARSIDAGHASEHEIRVRASRTEDSVVVAVRTSDARVGVLASIEGDLVVAREVLTSFGGDLSVVSEGYGQSVR
ncbi:hypothetical protein, partial [Pseudomonas sp. MPR-R5A]|uniref:hypothetical protein n=1 Tax=Pseudomonas sp. MPR-R5A TaxID=2070626 RepID=UPI0011AEE45B